MKPKVYIETSIVSYLTSRLSNDIRTVANQNTTIEWWETRRFDGVEYLLTWNCTHIANAVMRPRIEAICRQQGV
jgi:hypothetical protein